jgi:hypothetical protein
MHAIDDVCMCARYLLRTWNVFAQSQHLSIFNGNLRAWLKHYLQMSSQAMGFPASRISSNIARHDAHQKRHSSSALTRDKYTSISTFSYAWLRLLEDGFAAVLLNLYAGGQRSRESHHCFGRCRVARSSCLETTVYPTKTLHRCHYLRSGFLRVMRKGLNALWPQLRATLRPWTLMMLCKIPVKCTTRS